MNLFRKVFEFIIHPTYSRTAGFLLLLLVILAVPLTVFISQKQQSIKQRASGQNCVADYSSCTDTYNGCNQNCSSLQQGDYEDYDAYTQAYSTCTDKCSNDQSKCSTDAYNVYLQCLSSNSPGGGIPTPSINPNPTTSQEPSPTPITVPGSCSGIICGGICWDKSWLSNCQDQKAHCPENNESTIPICDILVPPTLIPTQIPTVSIPTNIPIPTRIPTSSITQNSPTPLPFPTSVPYCHLKNKGDADCDNNINRLDFAIWQDEFVSELNGIVTSKRSDFNSDGKIDIVDANIWRKNL